MSVKSGKTCILMFSGGYDSFLASCRLIEEGYNVLLVTYNNGMETNLESAEDNAKRLIDLYGERIEFLGVKPIVATWRELFLLPYFAPRTRTKTNKKEEAFEYDLFPGEMMCLSCRSSMYIRSIVECLLRNVKYLAEGARKSQHYPEQYQPIIEVFKELCSEHSIKLLLPIYHIESKGQVKEELIKRNIVPKTKELHCILSMPLYDYKPSKDRIRELRRFLEEYIVPKIKKERMIEKLYDIVKVRSKRERLV